MEEKDKLCRSCLRPLTDKKSLKRGYGYKCFKKIQQTEAMSQKVVTEATSSEPGEPGEPGEPD